MEACSIFIVPHSTLPHSEGEGEGERERVSTQ